MESTPMTTPLSDIQTPSSISDPNTPPDQTAFENPATGLSKTSDQPVNQSPQGSIPQSIATPQQLPPTFVDPETFESPVVSSHVPVNNQSVTVTSLMLIPQEPSSMATASPAVQTPLYLILDSKAYPNRAAFEKLWQSDVRFSLSWYQQRPDLQDQSPSGYDQILANSAVRAGWDNQEIVNMLIYRRRELHYDLKINDPQYYERTLAKARKAASLNMEVLMKPTINVNDHQLEAIVDIILQTLIAHQQEENLFWYTGLGLVRIEFGVGTGRHLVVPVGLQGLTGHVMKHVDFVRPGRRGYTPVSPPEKALSTILSLPQQELQFRPLRRIISTPVLLKNGNIFMTPGYDEFSGLYYAPSPGFNVPFISETPTAEEMSDACELIGEIVCDFPFVDESSRTNYIALLLTVFIRDLVPNVPLAIIDTPDRGTGKGLLAAIVGELMTGSSPCTIAGIPNKEELPKMITSTLKDGHSVVVFDNIVGEIDSFVLASLLTAPSHFGRILGSNKILESEQRLTCLAIGNNISFAEDFERRFYAIQLDASVEQPWKREGFRHLLLKEWVQEHRGQLIGAFLTIIRSWVVAGRPLWTDVVMGSFEQWTRIVGGILKNAGYQGFLANIENTYSQMSLEEDVLWKAFFEAIFHCMQDRIFTAKEISDIIISKENNVLNDTLPFSLQASLQKESSNLTVVLGKFFRNYQKRPFRCEGTLYYLDSSTTHRKGARLWSFHKK
jgi:hypothetical protein